MKTSFLLFVLLTTGCRLVAQASDAPGIASVKLYRPGDQASFPVLRLDGGEGLELHFDELGTSVRSYSYTYQLCNSDWTPSLLRPFDYIRGFQQMRITNYRSSSLGSTRYVHYSAALPERSSAPARSGNYLLKVFRNGDTSQLAFARRLVVVGQGAALAANVAQPFQADAFRSGQKLQLAVQTDSRIQILSPTDLKVVVLQNGNWQTALTLDRPTIYRGNYYEYSDEAATAFPALREFRWADLRSFRLRSDRVADISTHLDTVHLQLKPEGPRAGMSYAFYRDLNGSFTVEAMENINPFWQSEYGWVHFSYVPPGGKPLQGQELVLFGEFTRWGADPSALMHWDEAQGVYRKSLFLKQGFYNYLYGARVSGRRGGALDFSATEGHHWTAENAYTVLVYYRPFGARADELIGYTELNSLLQRTGL